MVDSPQPQTIRNPRWHRHRPPSPALHGSNGLPDRRLRYSLRAHQLGRSPAFCRSRWSRVLPPEVRVRIALTLTERRRPKEFWSFDILLASIWKIGSGEKIAPRR